jgi:putative aminopeptidase FrvX
MYRAGALAYRTLSRWDWEEHDMNRKLLKTLCETPGAPGREEKIRDIVREGLQGKVDKVWTDAIGNIIALRKGKGAGRRKKLMISAHMDEIGFMVNHIDDRGFLRFVPLGGFDPKTLAAQRVIVHGKKDLLGVLGSKPIHIMSEEERKQGPKLEHYYIDVGLPGEKVKELVSPGDVVTRQRELVSVGDGVNCKSFDDRVGVYVMLEGFGAAKKQNVDVYLVGSAQEEVGIRGAQVAADAIKPDYGIALDITLANDGPDGKPQETVTKLGEGAAIKIMDSSVISNHKMVEFARALAEKRKIPYQMEILPRGGTDTSMMQRDGGAAAFCISIPTRYVHTHVEMIHPQDVDACVDLLAACIEEIHKGDFTL